MMRMFSGHQARRLGAACPMHPSLMPTLRWFGATSIAHVAVDPNRMSPETAKRVKEEDKADLERERRLREQFASKVQGMETGGQQQQQQGGGGGASSRQMPPFGGARFPGGFGPPDPNSFNWKLLRLTFFGLSIYMIVTLSNLRNPNSPLMMMQGQPWWQAPADALVANTLIRHVVSYREQRNVKTEYETQCKQYPTLTFAQFLARSYPTLLGGYRTTQAEVMAALVACFAATRDLTFVDTIVRAVRPHARDSKAAIDNVMECLKVDFPQVFAPIPVVPQYPAQMYNGGSTADAPAPDVYNMSGGGSVGSNHDATTTTASSASA